MTAVEHSVKNSLISAFRYLLKPLVRMAVKNGVSFYEFSDALKRAYVDVATSQLKSAGTPVTPEGISVITSIEQKAVEQLSPNDSGLNFNVDSQKQNPLPRVLSAWHADADFTGPYGVLRDLQLYKSTTDGLKSFSDLAATYCPGFTPRALLDELIRTGRVVDVGSGYYRAVDRSFVYEPLSDESIRFVAQTVHNFCETLEINLRPESRDGKGLLQRVIYTRSGLNAGAMKKFDSQVRSRGQAFAEEIDVWLSDNQEPEGSEGKFKTGVGIYHYVVNDDDEINFSKTLPKEGEGK